MNTVWIVEWRVLGSPWTPVWNEEAKSTREFARHLMARMVREYPKDRFRVRKYVRTP